MSNILNNYKYFIVIFLFLFLAGFIFIFFFKSNGNGKINVNFVAKLFASKRPRQATLKQLSSNSQATLVKQIFRYQESQIFSNDSKKNKIYYFLNNLKLLDQLQFNQS